MPVSSSNHSISRPRFTVFIQEFVTNSGLFWIFDALRVITTESVRAYFSWPHAFLLIGSLLQTYVLSRSKDRYAWANFIALIFYGAFDVLMEGTDFFTEPYHIYLAIYSTAMALMYALHRRSPTIATLGEAIVRTSLLGTMYMLAEWDKLPSHPSLQAYWLDDPGHLYILFASLMFGILLGISVIARNRLEAMLQSLTNHLEQITNWIFDPQLVMESFKDSQRLSLKRVERTILFMDIRGFTTWSEQHDPAEVVSMLNEYYSMAEEVIDAHHGFKIQLTADEIMTRFYEPDTALLAARALQARTQSLLAKFDLGAGIGLHTGEVIEGIIGSSKTKQYGIIGDTVNTASRLQNAAKKGEVMVSRTTWLKLKQQQPIVDQRVIEAKGKSDPIFAVVL